MVMNKRRREGRSISTDGAPGAPLAPWTYVNEELFELEYDAMFLSRWQLAGHVSDVPNVGDFTTFGMGSTNVVIIRGKDEQLRAFLNVCRHRASRIFEGKGSCRGVIRCPYHGWTYQFDGSLMATPQEETFPGLDKSKHGLHAVQLDVFNGFLFVRVKGDGPTVAEQFAHTAHFFEKYGVAGYEPIAEPTEQVWDVNWKVAWDNYLENYHIPIGHPGLFRLIEESEDWDELTSGASYSVFNLKSKASSVEEERLYQEQFRHGEKRLPEELHNKWVQFGLTPNLGVDLYPEMLDIFQIIPLSVDKTLIRARFYGHPNPSPEEQELRRLNMLINDPVNEEDRVLCERVQLGLRTNDYCPGPLSTLEHSVFNFHEQLRDVLPVTSLPDAPPGGTIARENAAMRTPRETSV